MLILLPPSETKRAGRSSAAARRGEARAAVARAAAGGVIDALVGALGRRGRGRARAEAGCHAARRGRGERRAARIADDVGHRPLHRRPVRRAGCGIPRSGVPPVGRAARRSSTRRRSARWRRSIRSPPTGSAPRCRFPGCRRSRGCGRMPSPARWPTRRRRSCSTSARRRTRRSVRFPHGVASAYVRVVADGDGGAVRALNHFNKHAKGALVRLLAAAPARASRRAPASVGGRMPRASACATETPASSSCSPERSPAGAQSLVCWAVRSVFSAIAMRATTASITNLSTMIARNVTQRHQDQRRDDEADAAADVELPGAGCR